MALLTPQGVKRVYQCQKPEGREYLRRLLNWEEFDEVRDSRRSILLDTLYESIIFAVGKGFPWVEVVKVVKFTEELLKETKVNFRDDICGLRPYHPERARSRLISEAKQGRAWLVLGWAEMTSV
uniref:Chromosome 8 open reading frame 74 n=1 Tax=Suricata suricatta TaxID=37032 RepID=A0A673TZ56_SURSU